MTGHNDCSNLQETIPGLPMTWIQSCDIRSLAQQLPDCTLAAWQPARIYGHFQYPTVM